MASIEKFITVARIKALKGSQGLFFLRITQEVERKPQRNFRVP